MYNDWGTVAREVHASLDSLRQQEEAAKATMVAHNALCFSRIITVIPFAIQAGGGGGAQDLASIQKVVDALPELNRQKREVAKHVGECCAASLKNCNILRMWQFAAT